MYDIAFHLIINKFFHKKELSYKTSIYLIYFFAQAILLNIMCYNTNI